MAFNYNHVTLVGRICTEPVYKEISPRFKKLSFIIAINRRLKATTNKDNKPDADFLSVCIYGMSAEVGHRILVKGMPVLVWGKIQVRTYKKDEQTVWITEIIADNFQVLEKLSTRLQQEYAVENDTQDDRELDTDHGQEIIDELNETRKIKQEKKG
jgi:single stranded DNA-binding protein